MKLVTMSCPACGGKVEADEYSQSFTCGFCGTTTVIEKEGYNYADDTIREAELLIRNQKNYKTARNKYSYLTERDANDPRPWLGLIRCETEDFALKLYIDVPGYEPIWLPGMEQRIREYFQNYYNLEKKPEQKSKVQQIEQQYFNTCKKEYDELKANIPSQDEEEYINNYEETIKASNKIIDSTQIKDILAKTNEIYNKYMAIAKAEEKRNENLDYDIKEYTFEDTSHCSSLKFQVDFTDDTTSSIDNYDELMYIYDNRLDEIKRLDFEIWLSYYIKTPIPHKTSESYSQRISMEIRENKMEITTKLDSNDRKLDKLYNYIRQIILNSPEKCDYYVKKRMFVSLVIGFGMGFIPAIIISTLLCLSESIRNVFVQGYIVYPLACLTIGFLIAEVITFSYMKSMYKHIEPEKKYAGYKDGNSIYKDDMEKYLNESEITIGKNAHNIEIRNKIKELFNKYKKLIVIELIVIALISFVIVFVGHIEF